jgi:peptidoglycan/LPS O-acetylase OafA/YrhL
MPDSLQPATAAGSKIRLEFVDALRAFAALGVVLFHVYWQEFRKSSSALLPAPIPWIAAHGFLGVPVFFVISGFVIAHSVGRKPVDWSYARRFLMRRTVRLAPPYWAAILLGLGVLLAYHRIGGVGRGTDIFSPVTIGANVLYLQILLDKPSILSVSWTLCLEVQFYLVFIATSVVAGALVRRARISFTAATLATFGPLWIISMLVVCHVVDVNAGLFLGYWPAFFIGVAAAWCYHGQWPTVVGIVLLGSTLFLRPNSTSAYVESLTALAIYAAVRTGMSQRLSFGRGVQTVGLISYSLYLTHELVGVSLVRLIRLMIRDPLSSWVVALITLAGVLSCVGFAYLFYRMFEVPSIRWSHQISSRAASMKKAIPNAPAAS